MTTMMDRSNSSVGSPSSSALSIIFQKAIPIRITSSSSSCWQASSSAANRVIELSVRISFGPTLPHCSTKVMRVQLTSEVDLFFLYTLEVTEDDFQALKVEQCILVDFCTFPYKFIELLEHCMNAATGNLENPRFQAILYAKSIDATLSIVETNQFKHLSHLSLSFREGNDSAIKNYLAGQLGEFKSANMDFHEKLRRSLLSLEKVQKENDKLNSDISELKEFHSQTITQMKTEYNLDLAHEKEKAILEYNKLIANIEKDKSDQEKAFRKQDTVQKEQIVDLETQIQKILDRKHSLEAKTIELGMRNATLHKDLEEKIQECDRLCLENRSFDAEKHESSKSLNRHLIRLSALEQEVQDKNEMISNMTKRLEEQIVQRSSLEVALKDTQTTAARAEERAEATTAEANRHHQQADKLQIELNSFKAKLKAKIQAGSQQENWLLERQMALDKALYENGMLKQEIADIKTENESLKKKGNEFRVKLEEAQDRQKSNERMIQWLNQQLTDTQSSKFGRSNISSTHHIFRPTQLFLSSSDSVNRGISAHKGYSFPHPMSSLDGALSCITNRTSIFPMPSPLGQFSVNSKAATAGILGPNSENIPDHPASKASTANGKLSGGLESPKSKPSLLAQIRNTTDHYRVKVPENLPCIDVVTDEEDLNTKSGSKMWPAKQVGGIVPWKILPRPPPLSFVEARSELMNRIPKS